MPSTDTKVAGKKYKIKKKGIDVTLAFARVLVFLFDAIYTLIIVFFGEKSTPYRSWLLIILAIVYFCTAILMTVINRHCSFKGEKGFCLAVKEKSCPRCQARKCTTKEVWLFIVELVVTLCVISYYIGDNFQEAKLMPDSEKSNTLSTILIISGLIGIYFFSTIHSNILDCNKKKEKLLNDLMEKGKIEKEQWDNKINNNRNAENYEKLYKFIIEIFGVIPIIDGLYTSILEKGEACNTWTLVSIFIFIMIILIINALAVSITTCQEIQHVEVAIDIVTEGSKINGGTVKVFNGKVICKSASGSQTNHYEEITIEGGTKMATQSKENETMTICGTKIKITGKKNQTSNSGGITIMKSRDEESNVNITTSKCDLFYTNGTAKIEGGIVANDDEGTQENDGTMVYEGGTTTITDGMTSFTADNATIIGGEVHEQDWNNRDYITNYEGTWIDVNKKCYNLKLFVGLLVVCNIICIGCFLIADNLRPLGCGSSSRKARLICLGCSIAAYCFSMFVAFLSWNASKDWARKELNVQREVHVADQQHQELHDINEGQRLINS